MERFKRVLNVSLFLSGAAAICIGCSQPKAAENGVSAEDLCEGKGLGLNSQLAMEMLGEANQMAYEGLHKQAVETLSKALQIDKTFGCAYFNRAQSHLKMEEFDLAVGDYSSALSIQPRLADAYTGRGLAHLRSGDLENSIKDSTQAIAIDRNIAFAWSNRAAAKSLQKDHKGAINDYSEAISLLPSNAKFLVNRGIEYLSTGEPRSACFDLERAGNLEEDPRKKRIIQETRKALCSSISDESN